MKHTGDNKPFIVAVAGPTAVGKTEAAVAICRALGGEAINMDAMQVYQGMRVGTARISRSETEGVRHHMLAVVPPDEPWSVARYAEAALPIIYNMIGRGVLPVLVGGTGLYLEAIRRPLRFASVQADAKLRASLDQLSDGALRGRLIEVDPITAKRLPTGDRRRAIRALEIAALTGKPMSEQADSAEERFNLCTVGLTMQRGALIERIQARAEKMFTNGLPEEVSFLVKCGLPPNAQSMQAIGYKETVRMLRGEITRVEAIEAVSIATRQYAKRQTTWFRATPNITWFDRTGCTSMTKHYKDIIKSVKTRRLAIKAEGSALL